MIGNNFRIRLRCRTCTVMPPPAVVMTFWLLVVPLILSQGQAGAAEVELLTPLPGATILARNPETHLVLRQSIMEESQQVRVQKTGLRLEPVVVEENGKDKYLHFRLPLDRGKNTFIIDPLDRELELSYEPLQALLPVNLKKFYLFHQAGQLPESCTNCHDLQETKTMGLVGLKQQTSCATCHPNIVIKHQWEHSPAYNQQCLSCHQQFVKPWRIGFREGRIDKTCFACHPNETVWESKKYRHGALIGGCTLCHNPHGGNFRYMLWDEGSLNICLTCHEEKERLVKNENSANLVHGIIYGKGCTACHEPHASNERYMLLKPVNELCVSCHTGLAGITRGHPVANHPVKGPRERRRPDRELTCIGCHDPHGSPNQNMLIKTKKGGILCRVCHQR